MTLPTELTREIASRVPQPGFDAVLDRSRAARRRRRTTIAAGLAAAVVVGGLGFVTGGPGGRSSEPAPPAPTAPQQVDPRMPDDVRAVLDDDRLDLWAAAGAAGAAAVVWRGCDQEPCRFAVVARDGDEVTGVALRASFPRLSAVPGGWLVEDASGIFRLTPSGERTQIDVTGSGSDGVLPGDTAVETASGWRLLRGDKLLPVPGVGPGGWQPSSTYLTPEGHLLMTPTNEGPTRVIVSDDGGRVWRMTHVAETASVPGTGLLAGSGDHVAYALLGDSPDGSIPVLEIAVSHDGGESWQVARGDLAERLGDLSSLAVTPGGTTYVTTGTHGLVRIDADGNTQAMPLSSQDTSAFVLDDAVCVVVEAGRVDGLRCSSDDGTTWVPGPLPGLG